jgi:hypothetical protein
VISRKTDKPSPGSRSLVRLVSVATVAILSSLILSVPAQADEGFIVNPSEPVFVPGEPTPAMVLTTGNVTLPNVKKVRLTMGQTNGRPFRSISTCTSTLTSTLGDCAIVSVKVTENGVTLDPTPAFEVNNVGGIQIVFDNALLLNVTRVVEVSVAAGAYTVSADAQSIVVGLEFETQPANEFSGTTIQPHGKQFDYVGVSFDGGTDSVGAMNRILAPLTATLPANSFTKSGFNFAGWSCTQGGAVWFADQAVMTDSINSCPTLYAVWTPVGSSSPATTSAPAAVTTPAATKPANLATTGTNLSAWAPGLALGLGWMLVAYSRSLRASRARHLKI